MIEKRAESGRIGPLYPPGGEKILGRTELVQILLVWREVKKNSPSPTDRLTNPACSS
jgi:hypothetical protein